MKLAYLRIAALSTLVFALAGCQQATKPAPAPPPPSYDQYMQQAQARIQAQDSDGAKTLFKKAAVADPTKKAPWYALAQLDFNQQSYGKAIVDSQEVLQRDPADQDAESILTVAGLRVAVEALGRLHDESNVQGPAHQEAEKLAAKMRETLGQEVLVPPETKKPVHHRPRRAVTPTDDGQNPAQPAAGEPATKPPSSADPFSVLKGSGH